MPSHTNSRLQYLISYQSLHQPHIFHCTIVKPLKINYSCHIQGSKHYFTLTSIVPPTLCLPRHVSTTSIVGVILLSLITSTLYFWFIYHDSSTGTHPSCITPTYWLQGIGQSWKNKPRIPPWLPHLPQTEMGITGYLPCFHCGNDNLPLHWENCIVLITPKFSYNIYNNEKILFSWTS